jgi:hypothetical protein
MKISWNAPFPCVPLQVKYWFCIYRIRSFYRWNSYTMFFEKTYLHTRWEHNIVCRPRRDDSASYNSMIRYGKLAETGTKVLSGTSSFSWASSRSASVLLSRKTHETFCRTPIAWNSQAYPENINLAHMYSTMNVQAVCAGSILVSCVPMRSACTTNVIF